MRGLGYDRDVDLDIPSPWRIAQSEVGAVFVRSHVGFRCWPLDHGPRFDTFFPTAAGIDYDRDATAMRSVLL